MDNLVEQRFGHGLIDRPEDAADPAAFRSEEILSALAPANWVEKIPADFKSYPPVRNQAQSYACVAFSLSVEMMADELKENGEVRIFSPRSLYALGALPGGGMNVQTAGDILSAKGMTLDFLLPSDNLSETAEKDLSDYKLDAEEVAKIYKTAGVVFAAIDFETIASLIQTLGKPVGISIVGYNNYSWLSQYPSPAVVGSPWYHRIEATDFGLINGKKYISVQNSWGTSVGLNGIQFLDESYQPLIFQVSYTLNLPDNWEDNTQTLPKPKYQWNTDLELGSQGQDVLELQQALQYLGMFPISDIIKPTGLFGGITLRSVKLFQETFASEILTPLNLTTPTGIVGEATRTKLNSLFA